MLHALGCAAGGGVWTNPADAGVVQVSCSGVGSGSLSNVVAYASQNFTEPNAKQSFATTNVPQSWVEIRLPAGIALHLKAYQFSRGFKSSMENWAVYGTFKEDDVNDPANWYPLAVHQDDRSFYSIEGQEKQTHRGGWRTMIQQKTGFHRFRFVAAPFHISDKEIAVAPFQRDFCTTSTQNKPNGLGLSFSRLELFGALEVKH